MEDVVNLTGRFPVDGRCSKPNWKVVVPSGGLYTCQRAVHPVECLYTRLEGCKSGEKGCKSGKSPEKGSRSGKFPVKRLQIR